MIGRIASAALLIFLAAKFSWAQAVRYDVSLTVDPAGETVSGVAIVIPDGRQGNLAVALSSDLAVSAVRVAGQPVGFRRDGYRLYPNRPFGPDAPLEVVYSGRAQPRGQDEGPFLRRIMINDEGGVFPEAAGWYPIAGPIASFRLALTVTGGHVGVAPGRIANETNKDGVYRVEFIVDHPIDGMPLFTGPYTIAEGFAGKTRVRTYFHGELEDKSDTYLKAAGRYLDHYGERIGPYPYSAFHVVSSPLPVGLGYPYMTYIGRRVLQLPFIIYTSLPHEVLHSWWGNGVFVDYDAGNWAEGLTTYMADYALAGARDPQGQRDMRARWLADYAALPASRETSLLGFRARTHGAAQVVGYHKAAMLFHMLEERLGAEVFAQGLQRFWAQQRFKTAAWSDLREAFEQVSGEDLGGFFSQWLERTGAPELTLSNSEVSEDGGGYRVRFQVGQVGTPYDLRIPVRLKSESGVETHFVNLDEPARTVTLQSASRPLALSLDPDFDLFRRLPPGDAPALLREVMLAETVTLEVDPGEAGFADVARQLAERLAEGEVRTEGGDGPLLLIGSPDWIGARAGGALAPPVQLPDGSARVWVRRDVAGRLTAMIAADDPQAIAALLRPLPHYGSKSYLVFEGSRATLHGIWNEPPRSTTVRFE